MCEMIFILDSSNTAMQLQTLNYVLLNLYVIVIVTRDFAYAFACVVSRHRPKIIDYFF